MNLRTDAFGKAEDALRLARESLIKEYLEIKQELSGYDDILDKIRRLNSRISSIKTEHELVRNAFSELTNSYLEPFPEDD